MSAAVTSLGVHHVSINVRDTAESVSFYTEVLGLIERNDRPEFSFDGAWLVQFDAVAGRVVEERLPSGADGGRVGHVDVA